MKFSSHHSAFLCLLIIVNCMAFPVDMDPESGDLIESRGLILHAKRTKTRPTKSSSTRERTKATDTQTKTTTKTKGQHKTKTTDTRTTSTVAPTSTESRPASTSSSASEACPSFSLPSRPTISDGVPNSYIVVLKPKSDIKTHLAKIKKTMKSNADCPDNGKVKSIVRDKDVITSASSPMYNSVLTDRDYTFIKGLPEVKGIHQNIRNPAPKSSASRPKDHTASHPKGHTASHPKVPIPSRGKGKGHTESRRTNRLAGRATGVSWNLARLGNVDKLTCKEGQCDTDPTWKAGVIDGIGKDKDVHIYVLDTGVNENHEQFKGRVKEIACISDNCSSGEGDGHGTEVTSVAIGNTVGVAAGAKVHSVKLYNSAQLGDTRDLVMGFEYAISDFRAKLSKNAGSSAIINISIHSPNFFPLVELVEAALKRGMHVVVAAGNEGIDRCDDWVNKDSSAKDMINVGAIDIDDNIAKFSGGGSNFGPCVDLYAGGKHVFAAEVSSNSDIHLTSGTSVAAPQVVGIIAGMIAEEGNLTPAKMKKKVLDLGVKGKINNLSDRPGSINRIAQMPENWKDNDGSEDSSEESFGSFQG